MMRLFRERIAGLAVLALAGCAFHASPADGLQFAPPHGWQASAGIMGFMQFWRPPNDDREVLILFKSPKPLRAEDIFSDARFNDTLKGARIERREHIVICGGQPATYLQARGTSERGGDDRVEMVMANAAGKSYFAMYVRPLTLPADPRAEASLRELCAKP